MESIKQRNINDWIYYFLSDMISIKNFDLSLLEIDRKWCKNTDIYYIGYITIKNIGYYESTNSVNPLYFITGENRWIHWRKKMEINT